MNLKIFKLREILKAKNIEAALICRPENRKYFSKFTGSFGYALITETKAYFITDFRYKEQAARECIGYEIFEHNQQKHSLYDILSDLKIKSIGFEENYITYSQYMKLKENLSQTKLIPFENQINQFRIIKYQEEIECIRKAANIADKAFMNICNYIKPGLTENEIALELEMFMRKHGASGLSFETIVASGIRSAFPHGLASNKKIKEGDLLTLDFGCIYNGYCSDMTRTVIVGKANQKQKEIYNIVLDAQISALNAIQPHILSKEIDQKARDIISEKGYGKNFGHGVGHGVGLEIHEAPRLGPNEETSLKKGMVVTVEPGIYIPEFGGVRIEDLVIVTDNGSEILSKSPKQLIEL